MKQKIILGTAFIFSILLIVVGFLMNNAYEYGLCEYDLSCIAPMMDIGSPLPIFFSSLLFSLLVLFFVHKQVYKTWMKFAAWFIPLSLLLIYSTPVLCGKLVCLITREYVTWYLSVIYIVVSVLIIAIKSYKLWGQPEKKSEKAA